MLRYEDGINMKILIIEDEKTIREMVRFALTNTNFILFEAENCREAEKIIADHVPDLILLDWMLPGKSGIDFLKLLKLNVMTRYIPVIMLTAKAEEDNKIKGLEMGADDYIIKPFSPRELIARIKTVARRGPLATPDDIIQIKDLQLHINQQEVFIGNKKLNLSPINYRLLFFFIKHNNIVFNREQLLARVWPGQIEVEDRTVDVQIRRLRNCLKPFGYDNWIQTIRSSGYKFSSKP